MALLSVLSPLRFSRRAFFVACAALFLAACGGGGGESVAASPASAGIIENGEANIALLNTSGSVLDIEVLDVADGEISTLSQTVDGDRPVLLWFFSPH